MTPAGLESFSRHGGRIAAARAAYPHAPEPWLDLSTGINPRPYPARPASRAERSRLPDPETLRVLEAAAAASFGAPADRVVATPGSEAAIRLLPRLLPARSVAVSQATYGGHVESWRAAGAEILVTPAAAEAWVIVNPNNPDGRLTPSEALRASCETRWTIVDEAFIETCPEQSVAAFAERRLIVLRSFGKFYGLAGLRLGFVVADPALCARFREVLGEWPIGADALAAGLQAYADLAWAARARARLARDAARLERTLAAAGLEPAGGTDLFRLVRTPHAFAVFRRLAEAGVLCRPFADGQRLRFGLPGHSHDFSRLAAALSGATS